MSSVAQITANRANALLSTGPVTPSGKEKSSRNAAGPIAQFLSASEADQEELQSLIEDYSCTLKPATPIDHDLIVEMAVARLRRMRLLQFEASLLASTTAKVEAELGPDATRVEIQALTLERLIDGSKTWNTLQRYLRDAERTFNACLKHFTAAQTAAKPAERPAPEPPKIIRQNEPNSAPPAVAPPVHKYAKDVPLRPDGYPVNLALAL